MTNDLKTHLDGWLESVQVTDIKSDQMMNVLRTSKPIGETIKSAGGGQIFEAEPAAFYKLLRGLKPGTPSE